MIYLQNFSHAFCIFTVRYQYIRRKNFAFYAIQTHDLVKI